MSTNTAAFAPRSVAKVDTKHELTIVYVVAVATQILLPLLAKFTATGSDTESSAGQGSTAAQLIWGIAYATAAFQIYRMRGSIRPLLSGTAWLWSFVGFMLLSLFWSVEPHTTFIESMELIGTTIVGFYLAARFTLPQLLTVTAFVFGTIAILSIMIVFAAPGHGRDAYGAGAWSGIFVEKNALGRAMAVATIALIALLVDGVSGRMRYAAFAMLPLFIALLVGSNSMTATVDCVVVVMLGLTVTLCRSKRFGSIARFLSISALVCGGIAVFVFGFTPSLSAIGREDNLTGRADFWPYVQAAIADRPLFGYGYEAFFPSEVGHDYMVGYLEQSGGWSPYHAHNSTLQMSLNGGYAAVGILGITIVLGLWRSIAYLRRERRAYAIWPLMVVMYLILGSYTETYFGNYNSVEWIIFTAALLYPIRDKMAAPDSFADSP